MPVRLKAGDHWRRKRRVGEGADCDPDDVRRGGDIPIYGRTALRAEVVRRPAAVARAKLGWLPALDGKRPGRRWALDRHLLPRDSRLHAEHAAGLLLALVALAQGNPLGVGPLVRDAELAATARSLTRGHFLLSSGVGRRTSIKANHGRARTRPPHPVGMKREDEARS